jgi:hypothetical protein
MMKPQRQRRPSTAALLAALVPLVATVVSAAGPARAQVLEQEAATPKPEDWQAALAIRNTFVRSSGFDPFSATDVLPQFSLTAERVFARSGAAAFAAGLAAEYGGSSADARNAPAQISMWRLSAVAEGRYCPWQRAYGFVRFAPGMLRVSAELSDASAPNAKRLVDDFDLLSIDTSLGAAVRMSGPANPIAAWISAEGGYGWTGSHHLLLATSAAARDEAKLAPVDLGTIDPRGVFLRLSVAITY